MAYDNVVVNIKNILINVDKLDLLIIIIRIKD